MLASMVSCLQWSQNKSRRQTDEQGTETNTTTDRGAETNATTERGMEDRGTEDRGDSNRVSRRCGTVEAAQNTRQEIDR